MSNFPVLDILDKLGYFPVTSKEESVLYKSIQISLEIIGEPHRSLLVNHLCSLSALSEKRALTNYDIFEKSLNLALYKCADIITRSIRKELLPYAVLHDQSITTDNILDPKFSVKDILSRLRISEILDFVLKLRLILILPSFINMRVLKEEYSQRFLKRVLQMVLSNVL